MLASGLWHGTNWTFLVWGGLHGIFMAASVLWSRANITLPLSLPPQVANSLKIFFTFNLVCFAWIFFRADSISDALYILQHLFIRLKFDASLFDLMPLGWYDWFIALLAIFIMEVVHYIQRKYGSLRLVLLRQPIWLRWSVYYALVVVILMFGKLGAGEFIYARF
jgi:D-alanyl-lipoteichoic acid acyltransferase DltB (MBOAT superfamily)